MFRHRFSILLMSLSLLLLAGFLFLFLTKTWQDEREVLRKEAGYLFVNSVRGIEGEMLDKLLIRMHSGSDTAENLTFKMPPPKKGDSLKVITFIDHKNLRMKRDSNFEVRVHRQLERQEQFGIEGSLSMVVAMNDEEGSGDSIFLKGKGKDFLPMLEKNFNEAVKVARLPVRYRIVQLKEDSLQPSAALLSGSYTDLASGERYVAELSGYQAYLFRKIFPEALFSFALFTCVALAFFTVFKNLQTQRRLTELKNDFIRNVTHELKTPIATVGVAIEALQDFDALKNPERTKEYLDISRSELNRLSLLVDKVLRMSLFEKAEPELKLEILDLKALVEGVLTSMKLQFDKAGAQVSFETNGADFSFEGDRLHLASVIYNLLDNALKYSPGQPTITIGLEQINNQIYLRVKDNGIGISAEFQDRIFEKFFRVPTGDVHNVKGHGLGLSYVASVVQKHRGTIEVESREQEGTVFKIILPNILGVGSEGRDARLQPSPLTSHSSLL